MKTTAGIPIYNKEGPIGSRITFKQNPFLATKIFSHLEVLRPLIQGKNVHPITVEVNPTNNCNHGCLRCVNKNIDHKKGEFILKSELNKLIKNLSDMKVKAILWTGGGEPLAYKRGGDDSLCTCMELAASCKLEQGIYTNGSFINEGYIAVFTKYFSFVRISLDAGSQKVHERIHSSQDFEAIITNISRLVDTRNSSRSKCTIGISCLVQPENSRNLFRTGQLVKDLGVDYLQIKPIIMPEGRQLDCKFWHSIFGEVRRTKELSNSHFKVLVSNTKFSDLLSPNFGRNYKQCWGSKLIPTVGADCMVYLCCHKVGMSDFAFGNLKESSFKEIWYSEKRKKIIKNLLVSQCPPNCKGHETNKVIEALIKCQSCIHRNFL